MIPNYHNRSTSEYSPIPWTAYGAQLSPSRSTSVGSGLTETATRDRWVHVACDGCALIAAWYLSFQIRLWLNTVMPVRLSLSELTAAAPPLVGMLLLWTATAWWLRIYRNAPARNGRFAIADLLESVVTMNALAVILIYCSRDFGVQVSRSFVPIFAVASLPLLIVSGYVADMISSIVATRWPSAKKIAVMGRIDEASELIELIQTTHCPVTIAGIIVPEGTGHTSPSRHRVLGTGGDLAALINRNQIARIIMAGKCASEDDFDKYISISCRMAVTVSCPVTVSAATTALSLANHYGLQLLDIEAASRARGQAVLKRPLDFMMATLLLLLLSPLMVFLVFLVKVTSMGPVFYRSVRVGRGGKYFTFWKFRSMYHGTKRTPVQACNEHCGHIFKIRNDPRITPLGRFLRRHSLDELPQLFNVLKGDMSIVGPRPLPVEDLDPDGLSSEFRQWAEERATVRPGLTGLWQVSGRSNIPFEQMVQLDLEYVHTWSVPLDVRIILATPIVILTGRGAY